MRCVRAVDGRRVPESGIKRILGVRDVAGKLGLGSYKCGDEVEGVEKLPDTVPLAFPIEVPSRLKGLAYNMEILVKRLVNQVLPNFWSEGLMDRIYVDRLPAYKFFERELKVNNPWSMRLPSRFRRMLLERVGEVLRSQKPRKDCFYEILPLFDRCYSRYEKDPYKRKNKTFRNVWRELRKAGKAYSYVLVRQVAYQIVGFFEEHGRLPGSYVEAVKPEVRSGSVSFGPADDELIRIKVVCEDSAELPIVRFEVKLPLDKNASRWRWFSFEASGYPKLVELLSVSGYEALKPTFAPRRRKSGVKDFELVLPVPLKPDRRGGGRVLAVDLGERKCATLVVIGEDYAQLTPPIFIKPKLAKKFKAIWGIQRNLKAEVDRGLDFDGRLYAEWRKLQSKLNRMRNTLVDELSKTIVTIALIYDCGVIVVEDLKSYMPEGGGGLLNWLLSSWRRGDLMHHLEYMCKLNGLKLHKACPNKTSKMCPRCGRQGRHVKAPNKLDEVEDCSPFFYCPFCGFKADRDYVGALNVARAYLAQREGLSLEKAKALGYMPRPSPPGDRSLGGAGKTTNLTQTAIKTKTETVDLILRTASTKIYGKWNGL